MQHYSLLLKFGSTQLSTNGKMDKQNMVCTCNETLFRLKQKKILTHVTIWMNLEDIMQSGKKTSHKRISIVWFHSYEALRVINEKAMAPHSSTLAWKIPWMEEPGRLQSMGSLRVRHGQLICSYWAPWSAPTQPPDQWLSASWEEPVTWGLLPHCTSAIYSDKIG